MSKKSTTTIIPELDNAEIRRTPDGRASVYDLISVIGQQKSPREVWKRLSNNYPEVVTKCDSFRFSGRGQQNTPVTDRQGWAYIIGLLPNAIGKKYREETAKLVIRYLDADVTLAEDIVERTDDEQGLERLQQRLKSKKIRNEHTRMLCARGVREGRDFAICTNKTYLGLYGTNAAGLRTRKNLPTKANVRNHMDTNELIEVGFSENLSTRKIKQGSAYGVEECGSINFNTAKSVADFVKDVLAS
jgi:hypothetical protein